MPLLLLGAAAAAQPPRTVVPLLPGELEPVADPDGPDDFGPRVHLLESPDLDRFLVRAQEFVDRQDYAGAIQVLQDVLEGRVTPLLHQRQPPADPGAEPGAESEPDSAWSEEDDPSKAVFSADGRVYRPVRRLCHELLAGMPAGALELYRARFEVEAERGLAAGIAGRDVRGLRAVSDRFFVTDSGARALDAAASLLADQGRFRAAAQAWRALRELHPRFRDGTGLPDLSLDDLDLRLAAVHRLGGEPRLMAAHLAALRDRQPQGTVRLQGELIGVDRLGDHPFFAADARLTDPAEVVEPPARATLGVDGLIPLWETRFAEPNPYAAPVRRSGRVAFVVGGDSEGPVTAPAARLGDPGGTTTFFGDDVAFMEHNRLRLQQLATGLMLAESEGTVDIYRVDQGSPPPRVASYDFATMRVVADAERFYAVLVPTRRLPNAGPLLENRVRAYDRRTMALRWTVGHDDGRGDYRAITFLAAPTPFRDRLLLPVLHRGVYCLMGIDAHSGDPVFRTPLHAGGTDLIRAPGCPVVVDRETAYVSTNAGVVAAVDAYGGDVLWLRRYERLHPYRDHRLPRQARNRGRGAVNRSATVSSLPGFPYPSDMIFDRGRVVIAPTDSRCLLCLDAASGEVEWMLSYDASRMDYLLGHDDRHLYVAGRSLMCVELGTGIRLWETDIPEHGSGRGVLAGGVILTPGERRVHVHAADGSGGWRQIELPRFLQSQDPLVSRCNLDVHGAYLTATYAGGVECYGILAELRSLAAAAPESLTRGRYLMQAGDLAGAIDALGEALGSDSVTPEQRRSTESTMLALVADLAVTMAVLRQRGPALDLMQRCRGWLQHDDLVPRWRLIRVEVLRALQDTAAAEAELEALRRDTDRTEK